MARSTCTIAAVSVSSMQRPPPSAPASSRARAISDGTFGSVIDFADRFTHRASSRPAAWCSARMPAARRTTQQSISWIEVEALGDVEEVARRDHLAALAQHPKQQLEARNGIAGERPDLLGVKHEAVVRERLANPIGPGDARQHLRAGGPRSRRRRFARPRPASFASYIAMSASTSSSSEVSPEPGSKIEMPMLAVTLRVRRAGRFQIDGRHRVQQRPGQPRRGMFVGARHDHRELVAAQPGEHVGLPQPVVQDRAHPRYQLVPDRVAERVVDVLEVVEIDREHRGRAAVRSAQCELARELLLEAAAIEETR